MRCVASSNLSDRNRVKIESTCAGVGEVDLRCISERKDLDGAIKAVQEAEVIFGFAQAPRSRREELLSRSQTLRWIQTYGAGVDNIPLGLAKSKDVVISNASGANAITISEHVMMLILAIHRNLWELEQSQCNRKWRWTQAERIDGKRMTIVGTGSIGAAVAQRARSFGLSLTGVSRSGATQEQFADVLPFTKLNEVLPETDILVLACPLTDETRNLIDGPQLKALPEHGVLVDISRGGVVNELALLDHLSHGQLLGVGRDSFTTEPLEKTSPLVGLSECIRDPPYRGKPVGLYG